jgi:hypothetical protein
MLNRKKGNGQMPQRIDIMVFVFLLLFLLVLSPPALASDLVLDDYQQGISKNWKEKSFKGFTRYEVVQEDGQRCIKATSEASASALYYEIDFDPREYPFLAWRWKVSNILAKGDELKKEGDDYAARVYVVFPSALFWRTKAINYIWANKLPQGQSVPNPFSSNACMIAVQSGPAHVGQWMDEKRNLLEDHRKCFGEDPPKAGAVAIMTDTDNTGEQAVAWYGPIRLISKGH